MLNIIKGQNYKKIVVSTVKHTVLLINLNLAFIFFIMEIYIS